LAYPSGTLGVGISGMSVISLTGAIMNIFTVTFSAQGSMAALFVSSKLGQGKIQEAKAASDELKGFNTMVAIVFSIFAIIFATIIPYIKFISEDQYQNGTLVFSSHKQLTQVRNTLYVMAMFYPI
jgi:Na+-driven multidrug efflux pump